MYDPGLWVLNIGHRSIDGRSTRAQATRRSTTSATTTSKRSRPAVSWLADSAWSHTMRYDGATPTVNVTSSNAVVRVDRTLFVAHDDDILVNEVVVTNLTNEPIRCQLVMYASFDPYFRNAYNTVYFDVDKQALSMFGSDVYFALCSDAPVLDFATDKIANKQGDSVFADVGRGVERPRAQHGQESGAVVMMGELPLARVRAATSAKRCSGEKVADVTALVEGARRRTQSSEAANAAWQDADTIAARK